MSTRASYLSPAQQFDLEHACRAITAAYGHHTFLVGSVIQRADYRDVDLRCILDDAEFDVLFGTKHKSRLNLLNAALSEWLQARTDLPIDFQFQRRTEANNEFKGPRSFMGQPLEMCVDVGGGKAPVAFGCTSPTRTGVKQE